MNTEESLIIRYFPVDYVDSYERRVVNVAEITPDEFLNFLFTEYPWWINVLLRIRTWLVKPFGLKAGRFEGHLSEMIQDRSDREVIIGMDDRHLSFYVSLWCDKKKNAFQDLRITTVVKYNNRLGKVYFFFVRPFHKVIIRSLLKHLAKKIY